MKTTTKYLVVFAGLLLMACSNNTNNETATTSKADLKIWGNCDMCKETIEGALKVEGIKSADWNKDTKMMAVSYDSTKISLDQIEKDIAAAGYDTEKYRGDDHTYSELPECCQYQRKDQ